MTLCGLCLSLNLVDVSIFRKKYSQIPQRIVRIRPSYLWLESNRMADNTDEDIYWVAQSRNGDCVLNTEFSS